MSHDIQPADAQKMIADYQRVNSRIEAFCYDKAKIEKILSQKNCAGIRVYYGLKDNGGFFENALIIAGTDSNWKDINADNAAYVAEYGIHNVDVGSPLV